MNEAAPEPRWHVPQFALLGLGAFILLAALLLSRPFLPFADSFWYLGIAENVDEGKGLSMPFSMAWHGLDPEDAVSYGDEVPLVGLPPLYPVVLGVEQRFGLDPDTAALLLNVVSVAGAVALVGWLTYRMSRRSRVAPLVVGALMVTEPVMIYTSRQAMTEPLFLLLSAAGLAALVHHFDRQRRFTLVFAAAVAALVAFERFQGLALVATGVLAIAVWGRGATRSRLASAAAYGAIAVAPLSLYTFATRVDTSAGWSTLGFHPPDSDEWGSLATSIGGWATPIWKLTENGQDLELAPVLLRIIGYLLVLGVCVAAAAGWRRVADDARIDPSVAIGASRDALLVSKLVLLYLALYTVVLLLGSTFVDTVIDLVPRYWGPVYPFLTALVVSGVVASLREVDARVAQFAPIAAAGVLAVLLALRITPLGDALDQDPPPPEVYAALEGLGAELELAPGEVIFTNQPSIVHQITGSSAYALPNPTEVRTGDPNARFEEQMAQVARLLEERGGAVAYWKGSRFAEYVTSEEQVATMLPVAPGAQVANITVYRPR